MVRLVLFDIDGTLVHTGGAGVKAFAKTFATEFSIADHFERLKFAGRTDLSLVREFFGFHQIAPTPENFERFFEHYVFWLDHILRASKTELCPGVWEFIRELQELPRDGEDRIAIHRTRPIRQQRVTDEFVDRPIMLKENIVGC